jgi:hypothetical protein
VTLEDQKAQSATGSAQQNLGEVGNRLANPLSDLWALSSSINAPQFFDGNLNTGDPEVGGVWPSSRSCPFP